MSVQKTKNGGRGEQATADMKARIKDGWTVDQLWDRFADPDGIKYDYAAKTKRKASRS